MGMVTLSTEQYGCFLLTNNDDGREVFIQTESDFPGIAVNLGFVPCRDCDSTDGTIDCKHKSAARMISEAANFLKNRDGEEFDDPGYFDCGE